MENYMKKIYFILIFFLLNLTICLKADQNLNWNRFRGNNSDGISSESDWNPKSLEKGKILWQANIGTGYSSISINGNYLFTIGNIRNEDIVSCLNANTGKLIWEYKYDCKLGSYPGPRSTPTYDNNRIYTLSRDGDLFCLDAKKGKVIWSKNIIKDFQARPPQWGFATSVIIHNNMAIINATRSGIALDKNNGKLIWKGTSDSSGYATPVIFKYQNNEYAAIFGKNSIMGVNLKDGTITWRFPWVTRWDVNAADPLIINDSVFVSSSYNKGSALISFKNNKPKQLWFQSNMASHFSSFVYKDGFIYGNDGDVRRSGGTFSCIDAGTGKITWSFEDAPGSLIAVGKYLILLNIKGKITIAEINSKSFKQIAQYSLKRNVFWTAPVFVNKKLYIRNLKGDIVCLNLK